MNKKFFYFILSVLLLVNYNAFSKNINIVAKVNDQIITNVDLDNRLKMAIVISGLPYEEEIKNRLKKQVLKVLVDEKLKIQEAAKLGIFVSNDELIQEINILEKRLNIPSNTLIKEYEKKNVPKETIHNQLKAQLMWQKLLYAFYIKSLKISEKQISEALDNYIKNSGKQEYNFSEIFISFSNDEEKEMAKSRIDSLYAQANQANFSLLAEQFSEGAVIYENNQNNWTTSTALNDEISNLLSATRVGEVSFPIEKDTGYSIYLLHDRRKIKNISKEQTFFDLSQIYFKIDNETNINTVNYYTEMVSTFRDTIIGCDDLEALINQLDDGFGGKMGIVSGESIEKKFLEVLKKLPVGKLSNVVKSETGLHSLMLCSTPKENTLESIKINLENKIRSSKINNASEVILERIRKKSLVELESYESK